MTFREAYEDCKFRYGKITGEVTPLTHNDILGFQPMKITIYLCNHPEKKGKECNSNCPLVND